MNLQSRDLLALSLALTWSLSVAVYIATHAMVTTEMVATILK